MLASGTQIGRWKILRVLGKGHQGNTVYVAQTSHEGADCTAALKFPVPDEEFQSLSKVHDLPGVVDILDSDRLPDGRYVAMPLLQPSLEEVLSRCDHDGLGGRLTWMVLQGLGLALIDTLRKVHARGLVHCDLKPANILLGSSGDARPHLIDFGISKAVGSAPFETARGTLDFNSIRAGQCGERRPADDLEAVGWLLLRCMLGQLPWKSATSRLHGLQSGPLTDEVRKQHEEQRRRRSEEISAAKEGLLDREASPLQRRWPEELREYLRHARHLSSRGGATCSESDYWKLRALLCGGKRPKPREKSWEEFVAEFRGSSGWPLVVAAVRGELVWRPCGTPTEAGTEVRSGVPRQLRIRISGQQRVCGAGGHWLEVEPIWTPGVPHFLCERNWLLVADAEAGTKGMLLASVAHDGSAGTSAPEDRAPWRFFVSKREPEVTEPKFFIAGSWDDWTDFTECLAFACESPACWARIEVPKAPCVVQFQIFKDRNWQQRFYPQGAHIRGPENKEGAPRWQHQVPARCAWCQVVWDPSGSRSVEVSLWGPAGERLDGAPGPLRPPSIGNSDLQVQGAKAREGSSKATPAQAAPPPRLTLEDAVAMLDELIGEYKSEEFQTALHTAWEEEGAWEPGKSMAAKQIRARRKATFPPQCRVLPRFGFEASERGVAESYWAVVKDYEDDPGVRWRNVLIGWLTNPPAQKLGPLSI